MTTKHEKQQSEAIMNIIKLIWLILDGIVVCIFDMLLWTVCMVILTAVVAVASLIIVPLYHGHIFINKVKEIK